MGKRLANVLIFAIFAVAVVTLAYILAGSGGRGVPERVYQTPVAQVTTVLTPVKGTAGVRKLVPVVPTGVTPVEQSDVTLEQKQYESYAE